MKKKLNIEGIANELSGGSAFFPNYKKEDSPTNEKPASGEVREVARPAQSEDTRTPERSNPRTPVRPNGKRIITRNSFETYEDQMDALRRLSVEEKLEGKLGSMSAMVREAIDQYLHKKQSGK